MKSHRQSAFTLLECVASFAILGTAVVAGISLLGYQNGLNTTSASNATAVRYLKRHHEILQGYNYNTLRTTSFAPVSEDPDYETRTVITALDSVTREVRAEIRWTTGSGVQRSESLVTVRCAE